MRLLALDSALARASAAVLAEGRVLGAASGGTSAALAALAAEALAASALQADRLDAVAVTVGPGSFTGIRAGLALASGIGLAAGIPIIGVSVGEAIAALLPDIPPDRLWVAIDSRRGRIFLERKGEVTAWDVASLPHPSGLVVLAGDAAAAAAVALGPMAHVAETRLPDALGVGLAAARRSAGLLPPRPASPLYVDPPAALPARSVRPPPEA